MNEARSAVMMSVIEHAAKPWDGSALIKASGTGATYLNPWYRPGYGTQWFETTVQPKRYRGFLIYQRIPKSFDIVYGGVCVTQRMGWSGESIDAIIAGKDWHTPCPEGWTEP